LTIPVSDHCKGDKEVLINVVLWSAYRELDERRGVKAA